MLIVKELTPNVHDVLVSGKLTREDARTFVNFVENLPEDAHPSLVFDIGEMDGFDMSAIWEEIAHLGKMMKALYRLDRIAVIANPSGLRSAARLESALLPDVTYEVFSRDKSEQARDWVMGKTDRPHGEALRMFDLDDNSIVAFELDGRIDRANAEQAIAQLKTALDTSNSTRMLARIKSWHGFDLATLGSINLARTKTEFVKRLDRYAIVGGPDWLETLAEMGGSLIGTEVKTFDLDEEAEAVSWLKQ